MSSESLLAEHEQSVGLLSINSSNMEARAEHQKTKHYQLLYSFTTSMGAGLVILVLFWILYYRDGFAWQSNPSQQFYWHPFLMVLGMVFLYSQSMLVYRTFRNAPKIKLKIMHASIHFLAFTLSVIGLKAVFDSHNLPVKPIPNLYSLHSWVGLITVIIFAAQFLSGFLTYLYPGLSMTIRINMMPFHTAFGTGGFILAVVACMTGLTEKVFFSLGAEKYSNFAAEGIIYNFIGVFTVFYGIMVLYMVNKLDYKRMPLPEDNIALTSTQ